MGQASAGRNILESSDSPVREVQLKLRPNMEVLGSFSQKVQVGPSVSVSHCVARTPPLALLAVTC